MPYRLLVLALAVIWPPAAAGSFYTGNDLLDWCDGTNKEEPRDSVDLYNTCLVYLAGVVDADETISGWGYKRGHVCAPRSVTPEHMRRVWLRYARENPDKLRLPGARSALAAFSQAWPCKQ
jgi:hypothetical protein